MNPEDKLWFGKYKGETFAWVLAKDPQYIKWALKSGAIRTNEMPLDLVKPIEKLEAEMWEEEAKLGELWQDLEPAYMSIGEPTERSANRWRFAPNDSSIEIKTF